MYIKKNINSMKKIMHIAEPFATGVLSFLIDITKRQVEEYDIYILYGIRPLTPPNVESLFDKRIHLIKINDFKGALGTVLNPKAYQTIHRYYKQIKPDIIHLHSSASGFVGRWCLPCSQSKVFYTPHGYSFLQMDSSALKRLIFWGIEYLSSKRNAKIIACGESEYKEAYKLTHNSTFVNNGINITELDSYTNQQEISHNPIKVCTCGRILYQKNPQFFNKVALLTPEIKFIWIGEGELRNQLTANNIEITGWLNKEEVLKTIQETDIFIFPSLGEGLPISLLEAMYLKKICIVSNVRGNKDIIKSGINGFICESPEEYSTIIKKYMNNEFNIKAIQENAHQDVKLNYNADLMAQKYDIIYNQ